MKKDDNIDVDDVDNIDDDDDDDGYVDDDGDDDDDDDDAEDSEKRSLHKYRRSHHLQVNVIGLEEQLRALKGMTEEEKQEKEKEKEKEIVEKKLRRKKEE